MTGVLTLGVLGLFAGAGLWMILAGLLPGHPSLAETLAAMDYEAAPPLPRPKVSTNGSAASCSNS